MIDVRALAVLPVALLLILAARPSLTRQPQGKVLAFVGLFLLPTLALALGFEFHLERAKTTKFCLSCHIMEPYGRSLWVDDKEFVPAVHFQNNRVPRDHACYTCHTTYAMFGDMKSKIRGLRHLAAYYTKSIPDTIKLYEPYNNRECLHCHEGGRRFLHESAHADPDTVMAAMRANRLSCMEAGCHDVAHNVTELGEVDFWKEPAR